MAKPGLVLERDEHDALGGAGALAHHHDAADARAGAVGQGAELGRGHDPAALELRANERDGVGAGGDTGAAQLGDRRLELVHLGQRRVLVVIVAAAPLRVA